MSDASADNLNQGGGNNNAEVMAKGSISPAKKRPSNFYDNPHNAAIAHEASVRLENFYSQNNRSLKKAIDILRDVLNGDVQSKLLKNYYDDHISFSDLFLPTENPNELRPDDKKLVIEEMLLQMDDETFNALSNNPYGLNLKKISFRKHS